MTSRGGPGLAATLCIAALSAVCGLVLAGAILAHPLGFGWRDVPGLATVVATQGLAWWWLRERPRALRLALRDRVRHHRLLALWAGMELAALALLWGRGTAGWSGAHRVWDLVAAYVAARAALTAGLVALQVVRSKTLGRVARAGLGARLALLAAGLAAPALAPLAGERPDWQNATIGGLLTLAAVAACARPGAPSDPWIVLAGLLASPALVLGGSAVLLRASAAPLAGALTLTSLALALAVAGLAIPTGAAAAERASGPG